MKQPLDLSSFNHFYLMGIKGVAMTSIAQILLDFGKKVSGCDVEENFVTQKQLQRLGLQDKIKLSFAHQLAADVDCLIYTSAHGGPANPLVKQAQEKNIACISQAEALAYFFNKKQGIAICGVGGKSTVSAMLSWIFFKLNQDVSFSVGVGDIIGLGKTGQLTPESKFFIAEADEYVTDPQALDRGEEIEPRFAFMQPYITVCTNLEYDHPDVYPDFTATKCTFAQFFSQIQSGGHLIFNACNKPLQELIQQNQSSLAEKNIQTFSFGEKNGADLQLIENRVEDQQNIGIFQYQKQKYTLKLQVPGKFNLFNALAALAAALTAGIKIEAAIQALASFQSTMRRFELVGEKNGVIYLDDYAHHPHEIVKTVQAFADWYPDKKRYIAFQPHTYSRTKQLFTEFVQALADSQKQLEQIILLDIFASAREKYDASVSSDMLVTAVKEKFPTAKIINLKTIKSLADFSTNQLQAGDALLTMGAGDIYQVHELL